MRWAAMLGLVVTAAGCSRACGGASGGDDAVAPEAAAPADAGRVEAAASREADAAKLPPAARPTHAGDDAWVKQARAEKGFVSLDLAKGVNGALPLQLTWRVHPERTMKKLTEAEDYPGNHPRRMELVIARGSQTRAVPLGEHAGAPDSTGLTYCRALGYALAKDYTWTIPPLDEVVGSFSMDTMQSGRRVLVLLGHGVLHVLVRSVEDGACGEPVKQGPLEVCPDGPWTRLAAVTVQGEPAVEERVVEVDDAGHETVLDCDPGPGLLPGP